MGGTVPIPPRPPATPRPPGRPRGARRDPAERREELLAHAEDAIRRHGPDVSMELVAAQAGVSKATLYDNFDGKGGLTTALVDRYGNRVLGTMAVGLDRPRTARQVVGAGIRIFVEFIERDPHIYRFIALHAADTPAVDEIAVPITALLDALLRDAGADPSSADVMAHALLGAVFTAAERWAAQPTMPREAFVGRLVDFVWAGLVAVGVPPGDDPIDLTGLARALEEATGPQAGSAG